MKAFIQWSDFHRAFGKTSRGPLVIFKGQNKGQVRAWERQKKEEGKRPNKEPQSNLQNFDLLTHHSHPRGHGKITLMGPSSNGLFLGLPEWPGKLSRRLAELGNSCQSHKQRSLPDDQYSKRSLLGTWKCSRTLRLASSCRYTQCLVPLLYAISRQISRDFIWGFWDLPTAAKIVVDFMFTSYTQRASRYQQYQETFYPKVQIINFSSVTKQLSAESTVAKAAPYKNQRISERGKQSNQRRGHPQLGFVLGVLINIWADSKSTTGKERLFKRSKSKRVSLLLCKSILGNSNL